MLRSPNWRMRLAWAASVFATTSSPEVSLSSRCTIPGRPTPAIEPSDSPRAAPAPAGHGPGCPSACPALGWTTIPGRLVDDEQGSILVGDLERDLLRRERRIRRRAELHRAAVLHPAAGRSPARAARHEGPPVADETLGVRPADARHGPPPPGPTDRQPPAPRPCRGSPLVGVLTPSPAAPPARRGRCTRAAGPTRRSGSRRRRSRSGTACSRSRPR